MYLQQLCVACTLFALATGFPPSQPVTWRRQATTQPPQPGLARAQEPVITTSDRYIKHGQKQAKSIIDSNSDNGQLFHSVQSKQDKQRFHDYKSEKSSIKKEFLVDKKGQRKTHRIVENSYTVENKPYDLGDGTSIGGLPLGDSLLLNKDDNKKTRYTTLDKLFSHPNIGFENKNYSADSLGGLHPDEVFYADHNLLIIKGGGFPTKINYLEDNDLGSIENLTDVRPDALFANVPLHLRFLNGNAPTIVRPDHISLNPDADVFNAKRSIFKRSDKITQRHPSQASEEFSAAPSTRVLTTLPANNKVVQYHYQSMGSRPIVDYKIHQDGTIVNQSFRPSLGLKKPRRLSDPVASGSELSEQSFKPSIQVPADFSPSVPLHLLRGTTNQPAGQPRPTRQPQPIRQPQQSPNRPTQFPKRPKQFPNRQNGPHQPNTSPLGASFHGDTDVNFLPPVPSPNHRHAEDFSPRRPSLPDPTRFREPQTGSPTPLRPLPIV